MANAKMSWLAMALEGWQIGALVVFLVAVVTAIVVPRSAIPESLPAPHMTADEIASTRAKNLKTAERATAQDLPRMTQLVGARIRALGRAEWDKDAKASERVRSDIREASLVAMNQDPESLILLRAYQAQRFVRAYCDYLRSGEGSIDLIELGGTITSEMAEVGWLNVLAEAPHDTDLILSALFKKRFTKLVAPQHPALEPDTVEERALIAYRMQHPPKRAGTETQSELDAVNGDFLLKQIHALSQIDPTYPAQYARGIVFFKMGRFEDAAISFDAYLLQVQNGPYRLRTINHLKAAVEHTEGS